MTRQQLDRLLEQTVADALGGKLPNARQHAGRTSYRQSRAGIPRTVGSSNTPEQPILAIAFAFGWGEFLYV